MNPPSVVAATPAQRDAVVHTLTLAFAGDPVNRWYLPDADRFLTYFPQIVASFIDQSIAAGACFVTEDLAGAALWLPPGVSGDDAAMEAIVAQAAPPEVLAPMGDLFAQFENYHPHDDDLWYLPLIGVDPGHQGKGVGGALMKHALAIIDAAGALSYLESSTPKNVPLYERHGFEAMVRLPFARDGIVTPMVRQRR